MDFHRFVRKDLQFLCKLNKIPANRTNVAMAEALGSLKTVKGIEKFCKSTESSIAESSVESPEKNVVTSPKTTRTGRRKHVREGSGVVQTVTPVARGKNRVPVASVKKVQTVYNTRLSSRLLKREVMEMEKKECVEAVKISSYCDVASHNDYGEVSEEKNNPGSDNEGVESPITEDEQESERLKWKDADKDLESRHKADTNLKSILPENNGIQVDTTEAVLEMPSDDKMAVIEKPLHNKKDYFAVDLCPSRTDISTEVLVHEGSVNVDVELPCFEVEEGSEFLKGKDADRDSDSIDSAAINMDPEVLENNRLQVDTIEDVLEIPSDDNAAVLEKPLYNKNDVSCLSRTDISTEVFAHEGSVDVDVELPFSDVEQGSEFLKGKDADIDVVLSDSAAINMEPKVLANKGLQVDTIQDVLEMTRDDNMAVLEKPLHNKNGSANVDVEFPFFEVEEGSEFLKEKDADIDSDLSDSAAINMEPRVLENNRLQVDTIEDGLEIPSDDNTAVLEKSLDNKNGYFAVDLCSSRTDISTKVLAHEGSVDVDVELPLSDVEQGSEFLKGKDADIELDLSDSAAINMELKVLENMGLQVDTIQDVLELSSNDNMAVLEKPLHNKNDDSCLSRTDISTEVFAHEGSVDVELPFSEVEQGIEFLMGKDADRDLDSSDSAAINMEPKILENNGLQVDTIEDVLEMLCDDNIAVLEILLHKKKVVFSPSRTDISTEVLAHEVSVDVGVESPVPQIEQESESLTWKDVDKDQDSGDIAAANMKSKVLENYGLQVYTIEDFLEMPSDDCMAVLEKPLHDKDVFGAELCLSKTDISIELLAHEGSVDVGVDSPVPQIEQESESLKWKDADKDQDSGDIAAANMKSKVLENNEFEGLQVDTIEAILEMLSEDNMAVIDKPLHNKKGSVYEAVELPVFEIEIEREPLKWNDADEDLDLSDTATANLTSKVLENTGLQMDTMLESVFEMTSDDNMVVTDKPLHKKKDNVGVDLCLSKTDVLTKVLAHEGSYNVGVDSSISEIEERSEFLNGKKSDKDLDSRDPTATNMKSHVLENNWLQLDTGESILEMSRNDITAVVDLALNNKKVEESFQVIPLKPISEMLSNDNKAVVDMLHHEMRDDVVVDRSPSGVDMTTEILAHEVELLTIDTRMAVEETPNHETKADEQVFSSPKIGSDNVGVHFTFLEGSDDVGVQFSFLENDENVDAHVTSSTDSQESDSLKEQLKSESSEKLNCGELVQDLTIQPMSEKNVFDCSEVKFPSFFKQSGQMCPSSAPSVLPPRKAKIAGNEPPLIMADYPFIRKNLTPGPNFKLKSNVSNDKENMEQNEKKVEVTKEKAHKDKKEFGVGKKSDVWLHVRSPR